jgi:hypothetical protein
MKPLLHLRFCKSKQKLRSHVDAMTGDLSVRGSGNRRDAAVAADIARPHVARGCASTCRLSAVRVVNRYHAKTDWLRARDAVQKKPRQRDSGGRKALRAKSGGLRTGGRRTRARVRIAGALRRATDLLRRHLERRNEPPFRSRLVVG